MPNSDADSRDAAITVLRRAVRRRRITELGLAVGIAVIASVHAISPVANNRPTFKLVILAVMGVAAIALAHAGSRAIDKDKALRVLVDRPGDVVWIYFLSALHVGLADGTMLSFVVPKPRHEEFVQAASTLAPQATVGFDHAVQQQFRSAPSSLRRAA